MSRRSAATEPMFAPVEDEEKKRTPSRRRGAPEPMIDPVEDEEKKRSSPPLFGGPRMKLAPYAIIVLLLLWNVSLQWRRVKAAEPQLGPQPCKSDVAPPSSIASELKSTNTVVNLVEATHEASTINKMQGHDYPPPMEATSAPAAAPSSTALNSPAIPDSIENTQSSSSAGAAAAGADLTITAAATAAPTAALPPEPAPKHAPEPAGGFRLDRGTECLSNATSKDTPTAQCYDGCQEKFARAHCGRCRCRACNFCPPPPGNSRMALDSSCLSDFTLDVPTAQCATFCVEKFALVHCKRCRCRACDFCPAVDTVHTATNTAVSMGVLPAAAAAPKAKRPAAPDAVNASAAPSLNATRAVTTAVQNATRPAAPDVVNASAARSLN